MNNYTHNKALFYNALYFYAKGGGFCDDEGGVEEEGEGREKILVTIKQQGFYFR